MTLTQRREVVRRFMDGEYVASIANWMASIYPTDAPFALVEQVLRDYMNGKFTLKAKRKARSRA